MPVEEKKTPSLGVINWYPGHIARAERELKAYLRRVDVVVEARDARIAGTTAHPKVEEWISEMPRVVAYTFVDQAPEASIQEWRTHHRHRKEECFWVDAKRGAGEIGSVHVAIRGAARLVNEKRIRKGIKPRAVRCAVIGFPNVGKSALINKLAGRKVVKSENRAGVTRQLTWIRVSGPSQQHNLELLDSPGIIPAKQLDQTAASRLAMCGDVGGASYDDRLVAETFIATLLALPHRYKPETYGILQKRYGLDLSEYKEPDDFLDDLADRRFASDLYVASAVLLADFRNGKLGPIALEPPPGKQFAHGFHPQLLLSSGTTHNILHHQSYKDKVFSGDSSSDDDSIVQPPPIVTDTLSDDLQRHVQTADFDGW